MSWVLLVAVLVAACVGYVVACVVVTGRQAVAPLAPTPAEADAQRNAEEHRTIARQETAKNEAEIATATHAQKLASLSALRRTRK